MYTTYADKATEKADVYAWVVRDLMCEAMKVGRCEQRYIDKKQYYKEIGMKTYWNLSLP